MVRTTKSKGRKQKENRIAVNSDNSQDEDDNGGLDYKNPFAGDDIEDFHSKNDKILLDKIGSKKSKKSAFEYSSNEEEVLAFDDSSSDSSDEEDMDDKVYGTDIEEENIEEDHSEDEPAKNWGNRKSAYYSGNKIANDEEAELEEEEARLLQAKMMRQLDTNDFGLDAFKVDSKSKLLKTSEELAAEQRAENALGDLVDTGDLENLQKVAKNLTSMSKKEKLEFLERESPELFELIRDFKAKLEELEETLLPVFQLVKTGQIPHSTASEFISNKARLYLAYCCHLSFYFVLKTQRATVENHPIVKNILQFRNLIKQIAPVSEKLEDEVNFLVEAVNNNKQLTFLKSKQGLNISAKLSKKVNFKTRNIQDGLLSDNDSDVEAMIASKDVEKPEGQIEKRAINYQISKNKGLTPKRNKMYRNPRVKYRIKAHSASVKYKSIVPKVRSQDAKYSGEATGIRTGVVRSAKFK